MFVMTFDDWDRLNVRGRTWIAKRVPGDGLILLKRVSSNGLGIDAEMVLDIETPEMYLWYYMVQYGRA